MVEQARHPFDSARQQLAQKERFFALSSDSSFEPTPPLASHNDELEQTLSELGKYAAQRRPKDQPKPTIFMSAATELSEDKEELLERIAGDLTACQAEVLTSRQILFGKEHEKNGYDLASYVQKIVLEMPKYQYIIPVGTPEYLTAYNKRDEKPKTPIERLEKKILKAVSKIGEQANKKMLDEEDDDDGGEGARILSMLSAPAASAAQPRDACLFMNQSTNHSQKN